MNDDFLWRGFGNITGPPGGPDFGQYPRRFNWRNFLIFPSWSAGYYAIAALLKTPSYAALSVLDAFKKYAPASNGNDSIMKMPLPRRWGSSRVNRAGAGDKDPALIAPAATSTPPRRALSI